MSVAAPRLEPAGSGAATVSGFEVGAAPAGLDKAIFMSRRTATAALIAMAAGFPGVAMAAESTSLSLGDGRKIPLSLWRAKRKPKGLIAFSHGANSAPSKYDRLGSALAAAGYDVAAPLHLDSPDHPGGGKVDRALANGLRLADMRAIFEQRASLGMASGPKIAAGHSFGGMIAQMLGGAAIGTPAESKAPLPEPGVAAVLAWSPPGPFPPLINPGAWKSINLPMLVVTGTADTLPIMALQWQAHRASFDEAKGPAALFVGIGVDHYFGNIICRPERTETAQEAQFADAVAVSVAFLGLALAGKPLTALARAELPGRSFVEVRN